MANAKQYSDLEQAQTVNNTDRFAVAQEGSDELKTVTTEQVAERVAGIVSTDQLQEFISDTALGKQVLAQALVNKGVDTSATDTLAQMAAKIDPLDVAGAQEYLCAPFFTIAYNSDVASPDTVGQTYALNYKNLIITFNLTSKTITTRKLEGPSTGWTVLAQVSDTDLLGSFAMFTTNKDQSSVAIATYASGTPMKVIVYDVTDDGALTKKGTVQTSYTTHNGTYGALYLTPQADKIFIHEGSSSSSSINMYEVESGAQESFSVSPNTSSLFANGNFFTMPDENTLVCLGRGSYQNQVYVGTIDSSTKTISAVTRNLITGDHASYGILPLPQHDTIVVWQALDSDRRKHYLTILKLSTGEELGSAQTFSVYLGHGGPNSYSSLSFYSYGNALCFRFSNGKYTIFGGYSGVCEFNPTTKELNFIGDTTGNTEGFKFTNALAFDLTSTNYNLYVTSANSTYLADDDRIISGYKGYLTMATVWSSPMQVYKKNAPAVLGFVYRRNNKEFLLLPSNNKISMDEYAAGAYAIKSTEAVLDITGEGE